MRRRTRRRCWRSSPARRVASGSPSATPSVGSPASRARASSSPSEGWASASSSSRTGSSTRGHVSKNERSSSPKPRPRRRSNGTSNGSSPSRGVACSPARSSRPLARSSRPRCSRSARSVPNPGKALLQTPWAAGTRAIGDDGRLIRAAEVPLNGLVTVFPEGHPDSAQGQAVLVRVPPALAAGGAATGEAGGLLAFSKICTHAGCPVGLYQASTHQLLCPCHQSAFDVLARRQAGARPGRSPAAAPAASPSTPTATSSPPAASRSRSAPPGGRGHERPRRPRDDRPLRHRDARASWPAAAARRRPSTPTGAAPGRSPGSGG